MTIYKGLGLEQSILLADLIVKPKHSIIHQSYDCHERFHNTGLPSQLNADGFGIGWYAEKLYSHAKDRVPLEICEVVSPHMKSSTRPSLGGRRHSMSEDGVVVPRNREYETPCIFTSISPAWNNRNLVQLADKVRSVVVVVVPIIVRSVTYL
jgi:predicted glutamine amidotransferase